MAETRNEAQQTRTTTKSDLPAGATRTTVITETAAAPPRPTKAYKLKDGAKHVQDGASVRPGDTVQLTESQARAFQDKFEAVDASDFEVKDDPQPYSRAAADKAREAENPEKPSREEAPQGDAIQTPPAVVRQTAPTATRPADPTTLDPAKQGQHSRETRNLIDSGAGPVPVAMKEPPKEGETTAAVPAVPRTGPAVGTGASTTKGPDAGPLTPKSDVKESSSSSLGKK